MIYEIVNPSDKYTFEAPDHVIATTVVLLIGDGKYAARTEDESWTGPVFAWGPRRNLDTWYTNHDTTLSEVIVQRREELHAAFCSVVIGDFKQRAEYMARLMDIVDPLEREKFAFDWYDDKRSSMNQIGRRAEGFAERLAG